jgi:hypothetical protein
MPIVRRMITVENPLTHSKEQVAHEHFVRRTQLKRGDVIVAEHELDDAVVADLASRFPTEKQQKRTYAELAQERDVEVLVGSSLAQFLEVKKEEALAMVAGNDDIEELGAWLAAEESQRKPRRVVLEALEDRIDEIAESPEDEDYLPVEEEEEVVVEEEEEEEVVD